MKLATALLCGLVLVACRARTPETTASLRAELTMTVEALVKALQEKTGYNFTYSAETGTAIRETTVHLREAEMPAADPQPYLGSLLAGTGLECKRVGPESLRTILIQQRPG
jgi:hypothetical protein